ncbi:MAG: dienelactone hydrolase family protein [Flavobacteriaceae bacterium]
MKTITFHFLALGFLFSMSLNAQFSHQKVTFESANPFSLSDIITALNEQEKQTVFGQLTLPVDSLTLDKKYPLIIGVAGSMGWREHHRDYMQMYQNDGFATFELNSFKSRNISSTVGSQDEVTIAAIILDAYRALEKLAQHPNIDKDKVAITGWSLGGGVALFSGWLPVKQAITKKYSFAAHLPFYPPCFIDPENVDFTNAPIHILIGASDNWTPAQPCVNLVDKLQEKANIDITVYPESHHSFDSQTPITRNENGYSFKDCLFTLTTEGDVLMNYLSLPMSSPLLQKLGFLFCVERGVNAGGNPAARQASLAFAKTFMRQTLTSNNGE